MTLTLLGAARSIQVLGLLGVAAGIIATNLAPRCGDGLYIGAGVLGAGLDLGAIAIGRAAGAIPLSILKVLVVLGGLSVGVSCAHVALPPPPVPVDLGPMLIVGSAVPSVIGAILLRFAR